MTYCGNCHSQMVSVGNDDGHTDRMYRFVSGFYHGSSRDDMCSGPLRDQAGETPIIVITIDRIGYWLV